MEKEFNEELERIKKEKIENMMESRQGPKFPDSPIKLSDNNFQKAAEKYPFLVVDFWAEWCGPCKMMEPIISELAEKYSSKEVVFGKINVDKNTRIPGKFQVSGIPTLLFIKNGRVVERVVGAASKQNLEAKLNKYID